MRREQNKHLHHSPGLGWPDTGIKRQQTPIRCIERTAGRPRQPASMTQPYMQGRLHALPCSGPETAMRRVRHCSQWSSLPGPTNAGARAPTDPYTSPGPIPARAGTGATAAPLGARQRRALCSRP